MSVKVNNNLKPENTLGDPNNTQLIMLQTLLDISAGLYNSRNFEDISKTIIDNLSKFKIDTEIRIKFGVYDAEKDQYRIIANTGESNPEHFTLADPPEPIALKEVKYYSGIAFAQKKTLVIQDNLSEYSLSIDIRQKYASQHSMIFIPLLHADDIVGLLSFGRSPANSYDDEFVNFLEGIAKYVTMAVVMVFAGQRRQGMEKEILENQRSLEEMNSELENRVIQRTKDLIQMNRSLNEEIEQRKLSELTVKKSEANLKTILNNTQQSFILVDKGMKIKSFNALSNILLKDLLVKEIMDGDILPGIIVRDQVDGITRNILKAQTGVTSSLELKLSHENYKNRWFLINFYPVNTSLNEIIGVCMASIEITERKRAQGINSAVFEIIKAINSTTNIDELFKVIHSVIGKVIDARNFFIALYDKSNDRITFPYSVDEVDENFDIPEASSSGSLSAEVINLKKALLLRKTDLDERFIDGERKQWGSQPKIWLGAPLILKNESIGAIVVQSYTDENLYDENDKKFLEMVSEQISLAISQKKAIDALQISEDKFSKAFKTSPDAITINRLIDGVYIEVNDGFLKVTGYENVIGKSSTELGIWENLTQREKFLSALSLKHEVEDMEYSFRLKDGSIRIGLLSAKYIDVENENCIITFVRDITERKEMEECLRRSEERFRSLVETIPHGIFEIDKEGTIVFCSFGKDSFLGYNSNDYFGKKVWDIKSPEIHNQITEQFFSKLYSSIPEPRSIFVKMQNKSGVNRDVQIDWNYKKDGPGQILGIVCLATDITERKNSEELIKEQASLLDIVTDAIFVQDMNDVVLFWNKGAERIFGWSISEAKGKKIYDLIFKDLDQYFELKKKGLQNGSFEREIELINKEKKELITETKCTIIKDEKNIPKSMLAVMSDVTDKRSLQRQYLRAQRMESLGTLASGVAHDLNNVLTPIMGSIQLLSLKATDEKSKNLLKTLNASAERGANIIKQILTFARGQKEEIVVIDLKKYISEIIRILKHTFPKNININENISKDLFSVNGDHTQIHQVLMNLCLNARDAMPNGGNISIVAENTYIDENFVKINSAAKIGKYIIIAVSDSGDGIPPDLQEKVFEPFFTTKDIGKGTGLGLSTAYSIIQSHGGFINLYSEVGKGTIFKIYLPATSIDLNEIKAEDRIGLPEGKGEVILVVDDEISICEITRSTLESFNYKVITANNGTEAISIFLEHKNEIQAIIVDMVMPVMDGNATIQVLQMMKPEIKIIAMSGFITNEAIFQNKSINSILMKPFSGEKLLKTLKEVLSS